MGERLRRSLEEAPVIDIGGYQYFVHPLTDGIPQVDPDLLREVCDDVRDMVDLDVDRIVTVEAMGIPLATALSLATGIPVSIVRKRRYSLPGEVAIGQSTGYSKGTLYVNGVAKGTRVLVVDDVVSTGGTLAPLLRAFRELGAVVKDVVVLVEKGDGRAAVEREVGLRVKTLARVAVADGRVHVEACR